MVEVLTMIHLTSNVDFQVVARFARGRYQQALLRGEQAPSGADLKGKAGRYRGRYNASAANLLSRLRAAGYVVSRYTGARGRVIVEIATALDVHTCAVAS